MTGNRYNHPGTEFFSCPVHIASGSAQRKPERLCFQLRVSLFDLSTVGFLNDTGGKMPAQNLV